MVCSLIAITQSAFFAAYRNFQKCIFDGQKPTGYYHKSDKNYTKNLINKNKTEFEELKIRCEAFIQNYFEKITDRDL
ncbi:MAG: hypothetical protein WCY06_08385 [Flavobacteriaceae bacterium]